MGEHPPFLVQLWYLANTAWVNVPVYEYCKAAAFSLVHFESARVSLSAECCASLRGQQFEAGTLSQAPALVL